MSFGECITSRDGLRAIYREPSDPVVAKAIDHVDQFGQFGSQRPGQLRDVQRRQMIRF